MSYLTRRERDAAIVFAVAFGIAVSTGFMYGFGLQWFSAIAVVTFVVYSVAGVFLAYRGLHRTASFAVDQWNEREALEEV